MDGSNAIVAACAQPASDEAFLSGIRAFLATALTEDLRAAGRATIGVHSDIDAGRIWWRRLYERGWIAPAWPKTHGGGEWTARQRFLWDRECALNDAPILFAGGLRSLGPLLIEMGTAQQRARYLQPILTGEDLWCQGFSEPGAGSDLAALNTRAVRDGDVYRVTGAKIWTTGAHHANRMFALVRTDASGRKQEGMTFLLIDMDSPGLTVIPIIDLAGRHEFNHVFFDDVRVPVANRVGEEDQGWGTAKRLMDLARSNNTPAALVRRVWRRAALSLQSAGPDADPALQRRLASLAIELEAFERVELDALPNGRPSAGDAYASSMLKLIGSELHQKVAELAVDIAGPYAVAHPCSELADEPELTAAAAAMAKHLVVRAATIYSGSSETQRNVIARQMLKG